MEPRLAHCTVARNVGVWVQQCVVQDASACCDGEQFTLKPGYLIAVHNGDGTDRLHPYVDVNGSTQNPRYPNSFWFTAINDSNANLDDVHTDIRRVAVSNSASPTPPPGQKGDTSAKTTGLIIGVVLGFILFASAMGLAILVLKYKKERRKTEELERKAAGLSGAKGAELLGHPLPLRPNLTPQEWAGTIVWSGMDGRQVKSLLPGKDKLQALHSCAASVFCFH